GRPGASRRRLDVVAPPAGHRIGSGPRAWRDSDRGRAAPLDRLRTSGAGGSARAGPGLGRGGGTDRARLDLPDRGRPAARARRLQGAVGAHGPLRDHQHEGVPGDRRVQPQDREHTDEAHPRHHADQAGRRPGPGLRALRVRVSRAGAGAARDPQRRLPRPAEPHDPARADRPGAARARRLPAGRL
ncbi:MAG: hypothetical protein AVDCRST_MAG29-64, partial [uncultured Nocardioidaceae bacterium]